MVEVNREVFLALKGNLTDFSSSINATVENMSRHGEIQKDEINRLVKEQQQVVVGLQNKIKQISNNINILNATINRNNQSIRNNEKIIVQINNRKESLARQIGNCNKELSSLQSRLNNCSEEERKQIQNQIAQVQQRLNSLKNDERVLFNEERRISGEISSLKSDNIRLNGELSKKKNELEKTKNDLNKNSEKYDEMKKSGKSLVSALDTMLEEAKAFKSLSVDRSEVGKKGIFECINLIDEYMNINI